MTTYHPCIAPDAIAQAEAGVLLTVEQAAALGLPLRLAGALLTPATGTLTPAALRAVLPITAARELAIIQIVSIEEGAA